MKSRKIIPIIFLALISVVNSQQLIGKIPIDDNEKNITNLSGALNDSISFHIIINKIRNSSNYQSTIYFYNNHTQIKSIQLFENEDKPIYLAFHSNDSILTLIRKPEKGTVIEDVNYLTGETNSVKTSIEPRKIYSYSNTTFIVGRLYNSLLDYAVIKNSKSVNRNLIPFEDKRIEDFFEHLVNDSELVNDRQFLNHGPIKDYKGFNSEDDLIFVNNSKNKALITLIKMGADGTVSTDQIDVLFDGKIKKMNSFIKDSLLFNFVMSKAVASLTIYNIHTKKVLETFHYNEDKFGEHNRLIKNGDVQDDSVNIKRFYNSFFPQAVGSVYNPELYVVVNKSEKNNYIVRVGHLDKNNYNNTSTNNYWWNYSAFNTAYNLDSYTVFNSMNLYGMSSIIFNALAEHKRKGNYFEITLDLNFNAMSQEEPLYKNIDYKEYDNRIEHLMRLKNHFYIPQNKSVRLINYFSDENAYHIYDLPQI